ncbi:hypothetical protein BDV19DRAFT_382575 [Aspergillus venezuelensis]
MSYKVGACGAYCSNQTGEVVTRALPHADSAGSRKNKETYDPVRPLTDAPTFMINPIDSTVNSVNGFSHACVSLGFAMKGVRCIDSTSAQAGAVKPLYGLRNSLIGVEWGSERTGNNWETKIRTFEKLGWDKENGSAALNLCAVAAGTFDLYWEEGCWACDVCAGWVILGGEGLVWEAVIDGRIYLAIQAASQASQENLVEEFWNVIQGRLEY